VAPASAVPSTSPLTCQDAAVAPATDPSSDRLTFRLLGPLQVLRGDEPLALGGPKQRTVLAVLVLAAGRTVSVPALVDAVWEDDPHTRAPNTLQVYMSNLRKALEPGRRGDYQLLRTEPGGYRLAVDADQVDVLAFEREVRLGRDALAAGDPSTARSHLDAALARWQGEPLADLAGERVARDHAARLDELHAIALEARLDTDLALGDPLAAVAEADALVRRFPYRERLRAQLMLALYRAGRQTDALAAYQATRTFLLEEAGVEPGPELRALEHAILIHDPALAGAAPRARASRAPSSAPGGSAGADADADEREGDDNAPTRRLEADETVVATFVLPDGSRHLLAVATTVIGRHRSSDLVLFDPNVSRRHAIVHRRPAGFVIEDLGSTNGVVVNGERVVTHELADGDEVTVGDTRLRYETA